MNVRIKIFDGQRAAFESSWVSEPGAAEGPEEIALQLAYQAGDGDALVFPIEDTENIQAALLDLINMNDDTAVGRNGHPKGDEERKWGRADATTFNQISDRIKNAVGLLRKEVSR